jgi:hypothetical protein
MTSTLLVFGLGIRGPGRRDERDDKTHGNPPGLVI